MADAFDGMHICLVGPVPPPAGGMANQTRQLKQLLEQDGATVTLVAVNAPYKPAFVGSIPVVRAGFRLIDYFWQLRRAMKDADVVHLMANSGWSWHLFAAPAIRVAAGLNKPILVNYRGGHAETFFEASWPKVAKSLNKAQGILVPSPYLHEVFARWDKKAEVVPNVLDETTFYPAEKVESDTPLHLIVTRNLEAIYDVGCVIDCFAQVLTHHADATLSIAGSGPEKESLERQCEKLGVRDKVRFLGRLDINDMAELYRSADVMLNASTVDNSPNSLIEAMACGVPIVSTNVGGIPKLVTHEQDALLVPPKRPDLLAEQVVRLINEPELRQSLIAQGRNTIAKFTWAKVGKALQGHYQSAISQGQEAV
ncbi:glycosyltransferase family 4 protein [Lacimicrobium sp. SS2-24]|uniref:glycosyltransferase family 4 protein n=1 Tax=Lacimicrobium sp. SS2-24 TaxID=2005569 RepID=UPI001AF01771|nr:glycosyltransferase family 4 protein [Lacimicrobium sp. SS2-24]